MAGSPVKLRIAVLLAVAAALLPRPTLRAELAPQDAASIAYRGFVPHALVEYFETNVFRPHPPPRGATVDNY